MKASTVDQIRTLLRVLLGGLLLWAATSKLSNATEFLGSIYAYQMPLPRSWLQAAALVLPWVELLCGLLLVLNVWPETALVCAGGLIVVFLIATGQAWMRGIDISCGCFDLKVFGLDKSHPGLVKFLESVAFAFLRNLVLAGIAGFLLRRRFAELVESAASAVRPVVPLHQKSAKQQKRANAVR